MRYTPDDFREKGKDEAAQQTAPKILTPDFPTPSSKSAPDLSRHVAPAPKPGAIDEQPYRIVAAEPAPFGAFWCACGAGVVFLAGMDCLACREGWTLPEHRHAAK